MTTEPATPRHQAFCPARYERPGGAQPGDRIVHCTLLEGHDGDHEETFTGSTWPATTAPQPKPRDLEREASEAVERALELARELDDQIFQRTQADQMCDRLAEAIGRLTGVDIGEHSSVNDPWQNALDAEQQHRARGLGSSRHVQEKPLATPPEVAEYLGVPPRTLEMWRYRRTGPRWSKVGRHIRYRWADVDAWLGNQATKASTTTTERLAPRSAPGRPMWTLRGCARCGVPAGGRHSDDHAAEIRALQQQHVVTIVSDEQRGSGWRIAWRCAARGCEMRGECTTQDRDTALRLYGVVSEGHGLADAEASMSGELALAGVAAAAVDVEALTRAALESLGWDDDRCTDGDEPELRGRLWDAARDVVDVVLTAVGIPVPVDWQPTSGWACRPIVPGRSQGDAP